MLISEAVNLVSKNLGIKPEWLRSLIKFESNWNPVAKNPYSSARGLIQFIDKTAVSLGYKNSLDLVIKNNTIVKQLLGPVYSYLSRYKPFPTEQSLYMSVFYPKARYWDKKAFFPLHVMFVNPGIFQVEDYIKKVKGIKSNKTYIPIAIGAIFLTYFEWRKRNVKKQTL